MTDPDLLQPKCWRGTNFPAESQWLPYSQLFNIASGSMRYGNDTEAEIRDINRSILSVAAENKIDPYVEKYIWLEVMADFWQQSICPRHYEARVRRCHHHPLQRRRPILRPDASPRQGHGYLQVTSVSVFDDSQNGRMRSKRLRRGESCGMSK